jgi:TetR/AcrR family transcriptional repressor of lmrAB and yxaGH operons
MPRRSDARPNAIRTTSELLQRQGYAATGLDEVLAKSGAPKGSFYFHFPEGKEQLAAEAVTASGQAVLDGLEAAAGKAHTTGDLVRRLAQFQARQLVESDFELGCPVATVTLEMASRSEAIREACNDAFASWIDATADRLRADGRKPAEARELAQWAIATLEGALLLARASRDETIITRLAARLAKVLDAPE